MSILNAVAIALALSVDAFAASFAYGSSRIKIPARSMLIISLICSAITGLSMMAGGLLQRYIPARMAIWISFSILFILGIVSLIDSVTKAIIRRHSEIRKRVQFSLFNFCFIFTLYADPVKADVDNSHSLSSAEAASLGMALSLDGIAVGVGAALAGVNPWLVTACSLITNLTALITGGFIGNKVAHKLTFNLSWVSGSILIMLAITRLL